MGQSMQPDTIFRETERYIATTSRADAFLESSESNLAGRRAIAAYVVDNLIQQKVIVLDAGSTSFEIARAIAHSPTISQELHIYTNNVPAALCLMACGIQCTLFGGPLDRNHFCTLPGVAPEFTMDLPTQPYQAVVTAAAIQLRPSSIAIRARKPDQFNFKQSALEKAAVRVLAFDSTKWILSFDGRFDLQIAVPDVHIVVDQLPRLEDATSPDLPEVCNRLGYTLHVAARAEGIEDSAENVRC